jgi:hypothetical protein
VGQPNLAALCELGPHDTERYQLADVHASKLVVNSVTDDILDHVGQPLGLVKDRVKSTSNVAALRPRQQSDGLQRLAQIVT